MEEKQYTFNVSAKFIYLGVVTAENEEQAKEKCRNDEYDAIIDQYEDEIDWDTLVIEEN